MFQISRDAEVTSNTANAVPTTSLARVRHAIICVASVRCALSIPPPRYLVAGAIIVIVWPHRLPYDDYCSANLAQVQYQEYSVIERSKTPSYTRHRLP